MTNPTIRWVASAIATYAAVALLIQWGWNDGVCHGVTHGIHDKDRRIFSTITYYNALALEALILVLSVSVQFGARIHHVSLYL